MWLSKLFKSKTASQPELEITVEETQKQSIERIINETPFENAATLEEMDLLARERSDRLYYECQARIAAFDPYSVNTDNLDTTPLTSVEKYFLKSIANQPIEQPYVAGYWTYEYSMDFAEWMTKLIGNRYVKISDLKDVWGNLDFLTVPILKNILRANKLPVSGRKAELIDRIKTNLSQENLPPIDELMLPRYILTEKGKAAVCDLPKSATKNLELEDNCLEKISSMQFNEAYKLVCQNELNKIIPRGMGINWEEEIEYGLSPSEEKLYKDFMESNISRLIPKYLVPYTVPLKTCVILGVMLGVDNTGAKNLFVRVSGICDSPDIAVTTQRLIFKLLDTRQKRTFEDLQPEHHIL